jgi:hypothetical protein
VAVSQRFIDLLNMPLPALRRLASDTGIQINLGVDKWTIARAVAALPREQLEQASDGFLYAGSTSMSWFRLIPEDEDVDTADADLFYPLQGEPLDPQEVREALEEHAEGDPFSEEDRPQEVTGSPKLVVAREWRDGFLLTFAIAKRATQVIRDFEVVEVLEDEFFGAFLRPEDGTLEVRASATRAHQLHSAWLVDFAATLGMAPVPISITEADVRALRDVIAGRLAKYGGTESTGTSAIGTVTYGKADTAHDLFEEQEFADATEGYDPVAYDLLFDYDGDEDIRVHISTTRGAVFIRTAVPEAVVRYVYDSLRSAKS